MQGLGIWLSSSMLYLLSYSVFDLPWHISGHIECSETSQKIASLAIANEASASEMTCPQSCHYNPLRHCQRYTSIEKYPFILIPALNKKERRLQTEG